MTSPEINDTATLVSNAVAPENLKITSQKRIFKSEYLKSVLFLAAIYALIINQASRDKMESGSPIKEAIYLHASSPGKPGQTNSLLSLIYSGTSIIFYPTFILWK